MLGSWPLRSFSLDFETQSEGGGLGDLGAVLVQVKVFCSNEEEGWRLEI